MTRDDRTVIVAFPPFANLEATERALASHYKESFKHAGTHFDLGNVEWISPLTLCTAACWVHQLRVRNCRVTVTFPRRPSFAGRFLATARVAETLARDGVEVTPSPYSVSAGGSVPHATFERFGNRAEADAFLANFADAPAGDSIERTAPVPDLVSTGHLRTVVLQELVDNAYNHSGSEHCYLSLFETLVDPLESRKRHPIFAPLGESRYLEICVADTGPHNIVDTLNSVLRTQPEYHPAALQFARHTTTPSRLDDVERCISFAFEYGSTSQPDRRRQQLLKWLDDPTLDASRLATGLYDLAALARAYGGQIIVRTAGRLGTLDYSNNAIHPRIAFWRGSGGRRLARIPGSIVLLRVPSQKPAAAKSPPRNTPHLHTQDIAVLDIAVVAPPVFVTPRQSTADTIVDLEQATEAVLQTASYQPRLVAVVIDGLGPERKLFGALLELLARLPRNGSALGLLTDDSSLLEAARAQWTSETQRLGAEDPERPAFAVLCNSTALPETYGARSSSDATISDGAIVTAVRSHISVNAVDLIDAIRVKRVGTTLQSRHIRKTDGLYLIESAYYTREFYHTSRLLDDPHLAATVAAWMEAQIAAFGPAVIVCTAPFLQSIIETALRRRPTPLSSVPVLQIRHNNLMILAVAPHLANSGRLLLVVDVLCTGRTITQFIARLHVRSVTRMIALVDARQSDTAYFPIPTTAGSIDIDIARVLHQAVTPLLERPSAVSSRDVLIVDPATHEPTRYALPEQPPLDEATVTARAAACSAIAIGHLVLLQHHYLHFIALRPLLRGLDPELGRWLQAEANELPTTLGFARHQLEIWCLDESTGLREALARAIRLMGFAEPRALTRDQLMAPPSRVDGRARFVWLVLPAIASGSTVRSCLEFASAMGAEYVHLSIACARSSEDTLVFFQNLTQYRAIHVRLHVMFAVVLPAFSGDDCPACNVRLSLRSAFQQATVSRPRLQAKLEVAIASLEPVYADNAGGIGRADAEGGANSLGLELHLMSLYLRSSRDIEARKDLKRRMSQAGGIEAFVACVGRTSGLAAFDTPARARILYWTPDFEGAWRTWLSKVEPDAGDFAVRLRGFAILVPDVFRRALPGLFKQCDAMPAHLDALLVEAVRTPELFDEGIDAVGSVGDEEFVNAIGELKDLWRRGYAGADLKGVHALGELYWHLVRSAGWKTGLTTLATATRNAHCTASRLRELFRRFVSDGVMDAERRIATARRSGGAWARLELHDPSPRELWRLTRDAVDQLRSTIAALPSDLFTVEPAGLQGIREAVDAVLLRADALVRALDRIATRPGPALDQLRDKHVATAASALELVPRVSADCPAIAIDATDFEQVIELLLENEVKLAEGRTRTVVLECDQVDEGVVSLRIANGEEWCAISHPEGGLATIRSLCGPYGAVLHLPSGAIATPREGTARRGVEIRFRTWPIGR